MTEHPGTIEFVYRGVSRIVPAEEVDESIRFAPGADGALQPVVRVVVVAMDRRREISEFGPGGVLLRSTFQVADD